MDEPAFRGFIDPMSYPRPSPQYVARNTPTPVPLDSSWTIDFSGSDFTHLPNSVTDLFSGGRAPYKIRLDNCRRLRQLPRGLKTGWLYLQNCTSLQALPEEMNVMFLDISGCTNLTHWPESAQVAGSSLLAANCGKLTSLPEKLGPLTNVDLQGCVSLKHLPEKLEADGWLDVGRTSIKISPYLKVRLRWAGVLVPPKVVLYPEQLTVDEILDEANAEVRRVMIQVYGSERFYKEATTVIDEDTDAGGARKLLRVPTTTDTDAFALHVSVNCPSTGRNYLLRVPPHVRTCREGIAWTAGFNSSYEYNPLEET